MNIYDAKSIQQLTFREGVRARVGIYLGSADHTGVIAGLLELVNNATDEALVCKTANRIELVIGKDFASCRDYGRGMPHGPNDFTNEVMINLLTENHSGAKFDDNAYGGKSRGLNGTGSAATCCSSDIFKITSYRDNAAWHMEFTEGIPKYNVCQKNPLNGEKQGTYIWYKPSQSVFSAEEINFDFNEICDIIEEYSYFNKGITFVLTNAETKEVKEYYSKNGLIDFAAKHITNALHKTPIHYSTTEDDVDIEIIAQWTKGKEKYYIFSNGGENPAGGTPLTGMKTAITNFAKKNIDESFDGDMARSGLVYICSVNLKSPIYDGQTKSKITNPNLRGIAQRAMTNALNDFRLKSNEFENVLKFLQTKRKAEEQADKVRDAILNHEKEMATAAKKRFSAPIKLMDCEKHGQDSILYITEGKSAKTPVQNARNITNEAVYDIRGKIIGALKNPIEKVLENEEVKDILQILGCGIFEKYNSKKLNFGRLLIFSDRDPDGAAISNLIVTLIYVLCPDFIKEGRLGRVIPPLYRLKKGKQSVYFYSREEYEREKGKYPNWDSTYYKGIGECSSEDMKNTMFNEKERKVTIYKAEDFTSFSSLLELLMGEDVPPRRQYIFDNIDFHKLRSE